MIRRTALATLAAAVAAPSIVRADALPGRTFAPSLTSAPFPHASRAAGHDYDHVHYAADTAYADSTVGIYVPSQFSAGHALDAIVHFHGWNNHVDEVFRRYRLREQLEASGKNAVLIVPQGPKDAPDSGDGKLELDPGGLARLLADTLGFLNANGVTPARSIGRVVLSAHSGGYGGAGGALARGGVDSISDVLLFDAAYGYFDAIAAWATAAPSRHLLSVFTGDTSLGNTALMAKIQAGRRELRVLDAATMTPALLQTREPTFVVTDVAHDELLQKHDWYAAFLRTTAIGR